MAKRDYDESIKRQQGEDPFVYFNRGNIFMEMKEFEEAHKDYEIAI
jgi:hypothetical protein